MDMTMWAPVAEQMPDNGVKVLCYVNDIVNGWSELLCCNDGCWYYPNGEEFPCIVTHWMPIHPAP